MPEALSFRRSFFSYSLLYFSLCECASCYWADSLLPARCTRVTVKQSKNDLLFLSLFFDFRGNFTTSREHEFKVNVQKFVCFFVFCLFFRGEQLYLWLCVITPPLATYKDWCTLPFVKFYNPILVHVMSLILSVIWSTYSGLSRSFSLSLSLVIIPGDSQLPASQIFFKQFSLGTHFWDSHLPADSLSLHAIQPFSPRLLTGLT